MNKKCIKCLREFPATEEFFYRARDRGKLYARCKECVREAKKISSAKHYDPVRRRGYVAAYRKRHPQRVREQQERQTLAQRCARVGITVEMYGRLKDEQDNACAICRRPESGRKFAIDHCHETGRVRGLLCGKCNTALGLLDENPLIIDAAVRYVMAHGIFAAMSSKSDDDLRAFLESDRGSAFAYPVWRMALEGDR